MSDLWRLRCDEPWHTEAKYDDGGEPHYVECFKPVVRCEHGKIDPHPVEYPFNFPTSRQMCDGSPTLDPWGEANEEQ